MKGDKLKLLGVLVIGLALLNISMLAFFFLQEKGGHRPLDYHKKPSQIIIERLGFNDDQQTEYKNLIQLHRKSIHRLEEERTKLKAELYNLVLDTDEEKEKLAIANIGELQKKIEILHFNHFKDIKKLCNNDQLNDFEELSHDLTKIFRHPPPPKR